MRIDVSTIKKDTGAFISFNIYKNLPVLKIYSGEMRFKEPVNVMGKATNIGGIILIDGKIGISYETNCIRCLKSFNDTMELPFLQQYQTSDKPLNEDILSFSGDAINLMEAVENTIILNAPMKFLCNPNCKGLCYNCGCNLNETTCNCEFEKIDPRLAVLKKLLK